MKTPFSGSWNSLSLQFPIFPWPIRGTPGDDILNGTGGDDTIQALAGNDTISAAGGNDWVEGGDGRDEIDGGAGDDVLYGDDFFSVVSRLRGDSDTIWGRDGNDTIYGQVGDDTLHGGDDNDTLNGGIGADQLFGGSHDDLLIGGAGGDWLDGGSGIDTASYAFASGAVRVRLFDLVGGSLGEASGDVLISIENVVGSEFGDELAGDNVDNELSGLGGNDLLIGFGGDDTLRGGDGSDQLEGGAGADRLDGGSGIDTANYAFSVQGVFVRLHDGAPEARGEAEGDILISIENVIGSEHRDTLEGDGLDNELSGRGGSDWLVGLGGDDTLNGGDGSDVLDGGEGSDTLDGGDGSDLARYTDAASAITVDLGAGAGTRGDAAGDELISVENVWGSDHDDVIFGSETSNHFRGGSGADEIDGRGGRDTVTYSDSESGVTVDLRSGKGAGGDAAGDRLRSVENITGSRFDDIIFGDDQANSLIGYIGDDAVYGRGGDDQFRGGTGADTIDGGDGIDTVSYALGFMRFDRILDRSDSGVTVDLESGEGERGHAEGDRLISIENLQGTNRDDVFLGTKSANTLSGRQGDDELDGRGGKDTLDGGEGSDVLIGGGGADQLLGGDGIDTASYVTAESGIRVSLAVGRGNVGDAAGDTLDSIENVEGSEHNDLIVGDNASNTLSGRGGLDRLEGGGGDDRLYGDDGSDQLRGGLGLDHIEGGAGNDILFGNALSADNGADTFVFRTGDGIDRIADFDDGADLIDLSSTSLSFEQLAISSDGSNATIGYGGDTIILNDFDALLLSQDDFIL